MKKIIYTLITIITLSCISINANANIMTKAMPSCGQWVADKSQNYVFFRIDKTWILGFLSGFALYSNKDILRDTDNESIFLWIDNYCHENPLKELGDAGIHLFIELKKQKGLQ
jgi:hypothetical protein